MKKMLLLIALFILPIRLFPAGQVTHAYFGQQWINNAHSSWASNQKRAFMLGTMFCDISYPAGIDRKRTHKKRVNLKKVEKAQSLFEQGRLFHSFVDEFRERMVHKSETMDFIKRFLTKKKMRETYANPKLLDSFLKFAEDAALYPKQTWDQIRIDLEYIEPEELNQRITQDQVRKWHEFLRKGFKIGPLGALKEKKFFKGTLPFPPAVFKKWGEVIPELCNREEMQAHMKKLTETFDKEFNKFLNKKT